MISRSLDQGAVFAEIYDRHERAVYRYAVSRLGATHADDVTSETFLVAFDRRESFSGSGDARPWLLGIATTLMKRHVRLEVKAWKGLLASDLGQISIDEFDVIDQRLDARTITKRMGKALARLPAGDRDVLLLHTYGDLSYEAIGDALSIPVGTVRSRLNRARRKLRTAIDPAAGLDTKEDHGRDLAPSPSTK
ncbi:hypothetical protein B7R22_17970 [Subtercola boreus]|uniref:RNA polymerase subunit sigma-70 n=1 Tax=Subtercola boreus TaxID=120213 RepID=A0A3E0VPW5_9MICO|nr:hypothetical protein B7R22_17970 [Subtercola boreus]